MSKTPIGRTLTMCLLLSTPFTFKAALADAPPAPADAMQTTSITLQNVLPGDVIKESHWQNAGMLPPGVSLITAQAVNNALLVVATPAGLAKVRAIVAGLDIAPRQVQVESALVTMTDAQLGATGIDFALVSPGDLQSAAYPQDFIEYATGKPVTALLVSLAQQRIVSQGAVSQGPTLVTTSSATAQISLSTRLPGDKSGESRFQVTPRVNSDDSVTLALDASLSPNIVADETTLLKIKTLCTVKKGETMVIGKKTATGKTLLLFVTPTILPQK